MSNPYEGMNVMQKLAKARLLFLNKGIKKSGKNIVMEFQYFELRDIVPDAIRIFAQVGLLGVVNLAESPATLTVYNADRPEEYPVIFSMRNPEPEQIVSKNGKVITNQLQALGSSNTYLRRYLWMMALDITEPDMVDAELGTEDFAVSSQQPAASKAAPKKPATKEERAEIKKELVQTDTGNATPEQIETLKGLCKQLLGKDPEKQEDFVNQIALKTNGFTEIPVDACDQLCGHLKSILAEYEEAK